MDQLLQTVYGLPYAEIIGILGAGYTLASLIIRATPTPKDDEVLEKIIPVHKRILWILDKLATASKHK
jgi:hypothetical protein